MSTHEKRKERAELNRETRRVMYRQPPEGISLVSLEEWYLAKRELGHDSNACVGMLTPCEDSAHFYRLRKDPNVRVELETNKLWRHPRTNR
jgi:hypothetical protein